MFQNYFKTAIRNLIRNKSYTTINVLGLGVGIAVCLMIFLVIQFETSFDNFHTKKDRIYRVLTEFKDPSGISHSSGVPFPLPKTLRSDFPQLEKVTAISSDNNSLFAIVDNGQSVKKFKEEQGVFYTEPEFFEIFDFPWLYGEAKSLSEPNNIALTKETAEKYFGSWKNAIGKTIKKDNRYLLKVVGIIDNAPANSDFQLKTVISYKTFSNSNSTDWVSVSSNHGCYVLMPDNITPASFNKFFPGFVKKYRPAERVAVTGQLLQSIKEVHYDADAGNFIGRTISKELINTLKLIALFILLIACVNFINLSTAQSVNRAKEVSIRKVMGSNRKQLGLQFLSETTFITLGAVIVAVLIVVLALPYVKSLLVLPLSFNIVQNPSILIFLLVTTVAVTILAGFYPSIVLSGFNPVTALKSKLIAKSTKGISLRRSLVVTQFIIAQGLIIGTLIIVKQMNYFQNASMGFDKEAMLTVPIPTDSVGRSKIDYLKIALMKNPEIRNVSFSFTPPTNQGNWFSDFKFDHSLKNSDFGANLKWADADYINTYKLELVAGRNYTRGDTTNEIIVNEELLKRLGITNPQEAINKEIDMWDGQVKAPIVGVVKDFHSQSLQSAIDPIMMGNYKRTYRTINIKAQQKNIHETIAFIENLWTTTYPDYVFEYKFLDESIANFYQKEKQLSQLYKIFAAIAIFLSCLGLYGLASFMAVQRLKEVGIRKVLGATVQNVIYLFSKEFIVLITIAFVIATPIAWYLMHQWLQDFVYRIDISWWIFIIAGAASLIIALITVSFQAIKAAISNPIKNLRTE
ncbi:ABC transporter permease [Segetibacter aerophilus]|uniref:ABC transporter permease n=1 Tax=Segetibacter aerophilus TaxID=670293 RepID=A0A512BB91_9BACT|nr:ABC transporter permease [Segetibacter aerophilus]GEO09200.1 ABC transporter permease [Segetibacter aerophilus]